MSWVRLTAALPVAVLRRTLSLAAVALTACSGTRVQGVLARAPNGDQVLTLDRGNLRLFDVPSGKAVWQGALPAWDEYREFHAFFSTRGEYFVLAEEQRTGETKRLYSLWERKSGRRVSPYYEHAYAKVSLDWGIAVSDDGRWFATNRAVESTDLQVIDTKSQQVGLQLPVQNPQDPTQFSADSSSLFVRDEVFRLGDKGWHSVAKFPGAVDGIWVGRRLAVATPKGIDLWDGSVTGHIDYPFAFHHEPAKDPQLNFYLRASDSLLAICEWNDDASLLVYDVERGVKLFERRGLGAISNVTFRDGKPVLLTYREEFDTFVIVLDPATGRVLHEKGFGTYANGGVAESPQRVTFWPFLLPGGRYLEQVSPDDRSSRFKPIEY
ncbi:MAG: hypothetical protein ACOY0T_11585 [Myxococcota bacterium]